VNFDAITLCIVSERVFIAVSVYFVIDSVWKLLDTPSYSMLQIEDANAEDFIPPLLQMFYMYV
jgi:hypothetical protein